jgi:hypothetical protein
MKMRNLKIKAMSLGVGLSVLVEGCGPAVRPLPGDFPDREVSVAFPHHPIVMLFNAGNYENSKIQNSEELRGIEVTKYLWTKEKTGSQKLYAPLDSGNIGIKDSPELLFEHNFWIGYDLDIDGDGKKERLIDQYKTNWDGKKARLADTWIEVEKGEWKRLKDFKKDATIRRYDIDEK